MGTGNNLEEDLIKLQDPKKAKLYQRFFKTGKGEYGEGDQFLGIIMPQLRKEAGKYKDMPFPDLRKLINNKFHEVRMVAVIILVNSYKKADEGRKEKIVKFYLANSGKINNWDLVDISAPNILGDWFLKKDKNILYDYAKSDNLWKKRIAILSTFGFIRKNEFEDCIKISEILLVDTHDLIHKAVGWMLREVGKKDLKTEKEFLEKYYKEMPRTTLRYAIEKFPENQRRKYLTRD